jgi:hypothetical protein
MLISLTLHDSKLIDANAFAHEFIDDINNAIENCVAINETTSMNVENIARVDDDAASIIRAMSQLQRDAITQQILFMHETNDNDDFDDAITKLFDIA